MNTLAFSACIGLATVAPSPPQKKYNMANVHHHALQEQAYWASNLFCPPLPIFLPWTRCCACRKSMYYIRKYVIAELLNLFFAVSPCGVSGFEIAVS